MSNYHEIVDTVYFGTNDTRTRVRRDTIFFAYKNMKGDIVVDHRYRWELQCRSHDFTWRSGWLEDFESVGDAFKMHESMAHHGSIVKPKPKVNIDIYHEDEWHSHTNRSHQSDIPPSKTLVGGLPPLEAEDDIDE